LLEWEEFDIKYDTEDEIWFDIERLLKQNADLIVLNRARSSIAASAINGIPIVIIRTEDCTFINTIFSNDYRY
jgi:ABC-type Fe3+-hydroxamate transport system substrate-binding protein